MVLGIGTPPADELIFYTAEKMTLPNKRVCGPFARCAEDGLSVLLPATAWCSPRPAPGPLCLHLQVRKAARPHLGLDSLGSLVRRGGDLVQRGHEPGQARLPRYPVLRRRAAIGVEAALHMLQ
jgi:hypothetical protein